jgi:hypothetical protein
MRHGIGRSVGAIVLALLATQALAAPKRQSAKKPPAKPAVTQDAPSIATYIIYDIGVLRMSGKAPADTVYNIGKLMLTGRPVASTIYNVGTLRLTGAATASATYDVGTITMTGQHEP